VKKALFSAVALALAAAAPLPAAPYVPEPHHRERMNMNAAWKYIRQNVSGAEQRTFNDSAWSTVGLPHSFNDVEVFRGDQNLPTASIVWYRKHFTLDASYAPRRKHIEFEGVAMIADVWVNGTYLGKHKGGVTPFLWDITALVTCDGTFDNVIAVRVDNQTCEPIPGIWQFGQCQWWVTDRYGGIYRDVWLHITDNLYVPQNVYLYENTYGSWVRPFNISTAARTADVRININVTNKSGSPKTCTLTNYVVDAANEIVASSSIVRVLASSGPALFVTTVSLSNVTLYSPDTPHLYKVYSVVKDGGTTVDVFETPFGIRTFYFDSVNGFFLNGRHLKLKGVGHRLGAYPGLANAISDYLHEKDILSLKEMGGNFIKCGHSALDPAVLDVCDKYGIFHMAANAAVEGDGPQAWQDFKKEFMRDIVIRDRNRPSVIIWEINSGAIWDEQWARELVNICYALDGTRPTTLTANDPSGIPGNQVDIISTMVGGDITWNDRFTINENPNQDFIRMPDGQKPLFMSEHGWKGDISSRRNWDSQISHGSTLLQDWYAPSTSNGFGVNNWWTGMCKWTLVDVAGEFEGVDQPAMYCQFGLIDPIRLKKESYYALQTAFSRDPTVHIAGHWNHSSGNRTVTVWTNCDSVELFLNGTSLGTRTPTYNICTWANVAWQSGTLRAEARRSGTVAATHEVRTAGTPARVELTADPSVIRADGGDITVVIAKIVDANGVVHPTATNNITFSVSGPGVFRGGCHANTNVVGNTTIPAEAGMNGVTVRSTVVPGTITVSATATGLAAGSVQIVSQPLTVTNEPPRILAHPQNRTVTAGNTAVFSVNATGSEPLSYQWQRNGANITGANSAMYTTPPTTLADNGAVFRCAVSNAFGSVTSSGAVLTVVQQDTVAPARITDLRATAVGISSVTLAWTAPGDDGTVGTASAYTIRRATFPITDDASFNAAALLPGAPVPAPAGTTQNYTATGLSSETTYYFAIKAMDEVPNTSPLSTVVSTRTLPVTPVVSIVVRSSVAAEQGSVPGSFQVSRAGSLTNPLPVNLTLAGTAVPGADYTGLTSPCTIPAGSSFTVITFTPVDDADVEGPETVVVNLSSGTGYVVGTPAVAQAIIVDNDVASLPVVGVVTAGQNPSESGPTAGQFVISRSSASATPLPVYFSLAGTAVNGTDYAPVQSPAVIPAGGQSVTVNILPVDDTDIEGPETVILLLTTHTAYIVGTSSAAVLTIQDDDFATVDHAVQCTPDGGFIDLGVRGVLDVTSRTASGLTVELFVYRTETGRHGGIVSHYFWNGGGYELFFGDDDKVYFQIATPGYARVDSTVRISSGQWYHIAAQTDRAGRGRIFVNGRNVTAGGAAAVPMPASYGGTVNIGASHNRPGYTGVIVDEVRISSIARYSADFPVTTAPYTADEHTLGLWHCDEGAGTVARDESPHRSTGTLRGNAGWVAGYFRSAGINRWPSVTLTTPTPGAAYRAPAAILMEANAQDETGIAHVTFYAGEQVIGVDSASPYRMTWNNVPAGTYVIKAVAVDTGGLPAESSGVAVTVNPAEPDVGVTTGTVRPGDAIVVGGAAGYVNLAAGEPATVRFNPKGSGTVTVSVYSLNGRLVWKRTIPGAVAGTTYDVPWNGTEQQSMSPVSSGIYVVHIKGAALDMTRKIVIIR